MLLAILLTTVLGSGPSYSIYTSSLDPSPIAYPNEWYSNIIDLSSNHAGQIVTLTIYCNVITNLYPNAYVTVNIGGFYTQPTPITLSVAQPAQYCNAFTFKNIFLPAAGAYGPVSIFIYSQYASNLYGDLIASAEAYGSIQVLAAKPNAGALSLSYNLVKVLPSTSGVGIIFTFSLSTTLYANDYLVITVPNPFAAATTATTDFFEYNSTANNGNPYFLSTKGVQSTTPASVSTVIVYGINGYNSSVGSVTVSGVLNGITTPPYFGPLNTNTAVTATWNLEIFRFGTHSTRALYSGIGPTGGKSRGAGLVPGAVKLASWTPSNSYLTNVYNGITTYMDLKISTFHDIPQGGTLKVTYYGVTINNCYLDYISGQYSPVLAQACGTNYYALAIPASSFNLNTITPTITPTTLTLSVKSKIVAGTAITITNLVTFSYNAPTVSAISTSDTSSSPNIIDALASAYSITNFQSSGYSVLNNEPLIQIWNSLYGNGLSDVRAGSQGTYIFAVSALSISYTTLVTSGPNATTITLSGPFSQTATTTPLDSAFAFGPKIFIAAHSNPYTQFSYLYYSPGIDATTSANLKFVASPTQFEFNAPLATPSNSYINFLIYAGANFGNPINIYAPNFISNLYTKYEICLQINVYGISSYGFCKPLNIFSSNSLTTFTTICTSSGQGGLTATLGFTPKAITAHGTNTLGVSFQISLSSGTFDPALGSGVTSGSSFPTSLSGANAAPNIKIYWNTASSTTINYVPNPPTSFSGSAISFAFPFIPLVSNIIYTAKASAYLMKESDSSQYIFQTDTTGAVVIGESQFNPNAVEAISGATVAAGGIISSLVFSVPSIQTFGLSIILPAGFRFSKTTPPTLSTPSSQNLIGVFSLNQNYAYPSLYTGADYIFVSGFVTLTNLIAPNFAPVIGSAGSNLIIASTGFYNTGQPCHNQISVALTIQGIPLTVTNISPAKGSTVFAPGPNQPNLVLSCSVAVPGSIIGGAATAIVIALGFSPTSGTYSITGGVALSGLVTSDTIKTDFITTSIISNSITFEITITTPTPTSITKGGFSSITIGNSTGVQYYTSVTQTLNIDTMPDPTLLSGITSVSAFPNTIGAQNVFFQITFNPSIVIPAGSIITISGGEHFISDIYASDNTWSTLGFKSAQILSSNLVVVTRLPSTIGTAITIRKDLAYNIRSSQMTAGAAWLINIAYGGYNLILDPTTTAASASNSITYAAAPSATLSSFAVSKKITNAGETGYYEFSFLFSSALLSSYSIIIEVPSYFDPTFGPLTSISTSNLNYLSAKSSIIYSSPVCSVNHWLITCSLGALVYNHVIDIQILGTNPSVQTSTEPYNLYIVDSSSNIIGILQPSSFNSLITPIPEANIDLQSVVISSSQAFYSDYTFVYTYINSETYATSGYVSVLFPAQYNFYRDQPTSTTSTADLGSYSIATVSGINVLITISCNNLVTFTFSADKLFSAGDQVNLTVTAITNPEILSSYTAYSTLNTALDTVYGSYFSAYDFWTSKFTLYTSTSPASSSTAWTSRSYPNVNAAFVGFVTVNLLSFSVPTVNVIPGTYSPFYTFTTASGTVVANSLILNPTSTGLTIFPTALTLYPIATFGLFKVGAPIITPPRISYIIWNVTENPTTAGTNLYLSIYRSQIQIYSSNTITITATTASAVPNFGISLPIILSISPYFTYSSLTLTPILNSLTISFRPSAITFTSANNSVNALGFQIITVNAINGIYDIAINIGGADAAAYSFPGSISIVVGGTIPAINLTNIVFSAISSNSFTVTAQSTGSASIYWVVSTTYAYTINPNYSDLPYVKQYAYPITGITTSSTQKTLWAQYYVYNSTLNALNGTSYLNYTISLLSAAKEYAFFNMDSIPGGSQSYSTTVYGLIANTSYTITIWADNLSGNISNITGNVTTSPISNTVFYINFQDYPSSVSTNLINALVSITGQPSYLFLKISGFRRNLDSSGTVSIGLISSPLNTQSASNIAGSVTPTTLTLSLYNFGVINPIISSLTFFISSSLNFPNPSYSSSPNITIESNEFFYVNYTSAVNGAIYYIVEYNPSYNYSISSHNVLLGQGRNGVIPYMSGNREVTAGNSDFILFNFAAHSSGLYWITVQLCNSIAVCQDNSSLWVYSYNSQYSEASNNENLNKSSNNSQTSLIVVIILTIVSLLIM